MLPHRKPTDSVKKECPKLRDNSEQTCSKFMPWNKQVKPVKVVRENVRLNFKDKRPSTTVQGYDTNKTRRHISSGCVKRCKCLIKENGNSGGREAQKPTQKIAHRKFQKDDAKSDCTKVYVPSLNEQISKSFSQEPNSLSNLKELKISVEDLKVPESLETTLKLSEAFENVPNKSSTPVMQTTSRSPRSNGSLHVTNCEQTLQLDTTHLQVPVTGHIPELKSPELLHNIGDSNKSRSLTSVVTDVTLIETGPFDSEIPYKSPDSGQTRLEISPSALDVSFNRSFPLQVYDQLLSDEDQKLEQQLEKLTKYERDCLDYAKQKILSLESLKEEFRTKHKDDELKKLKKKQRSVLLKVHQEVRQIQKHKSALNEIIADRKLKLKKFKDEISKDRKTMKIKEKPSPKSKDKDTRCSSEYVSTSSEVDKNKNVTSEAPFTSSPLSTSDYENIFNLLSLNGDIKHELEDFEPTWKSEKVTEVAGDKIAREMRDFATSPININIIEEMFPLNGITGEVNRNMQQIQSDNTATSLSDKENDLKHAENAGQRKVKSYPESKLRPLKANTSHNAMTAVSALPTRLSISPVLLRKPHLKNVGSGSEDSPLSFNDTTMSSEPSDTEARILALQEELNQRKSEASRLRKMQRQIRRERLKVQELSLMKQIEAYDRYIEKTKKELSEVINTPKKSETSDTPLTSHGIFDLIADSRKDTPERAELLKLSASDGESPGVQSIHNKSKLQDNEIFSEFQRNEIAAENSEITRDSSMLIEGNLGVETSDFRRTWGSGDRVVVPNVAVTTSDSDITLGAVGGFYIDDSFKQHILNELVNFMECVQVEPNTEQSAVIYEIPDSPKSDGVDSSKALKRTESKSEDSNASLKMSESVSDSLKSDSADLGRSTTESKSKELNRVELLKMSGISESVQPMDLEICSESGLINRESTELFSGSRNSEPSSLLKKADNGVNSTFSAISEDELNQLENVSAVFNEVFEDLNRIENTVITRDLNRNTDLTTIISNLTQCSNLNENELIRAKETTKDSSTVDKDLSGQLEDVLEFLESYGKNQNSESSKNESDEVIIPSAISDGLVQSDKRELNESLKPNNKIENNGSADLELNHAESVLTVFDESFISSLHKNSVAFLVHEIHKNQNEVSRHDVEHSKAVEKSLDHRDSNQNTYDSLEDIVTDESLCSESEEDSDSKSVMSDVSEHVRFAKNDSSKASTVNTLPSQNHEDLIKNNSQQVQEKLDLRSLSNSSGKYLTSEANDLEVPDTSLKLVESDLGSAENVNSDGSKLSDETMEVEGKVHSEKSAETGSSRSQDEDFSSPEDSKNNDSMGEDACIEKPVSGDKSLASQSPVDECREVQGSPDLISWVDRVDLDSVSNTSSKHFSETDESVHNSKSCENLENSAERRVTLVGDDLENVKTDSGVNFDSRGIETNNNLNETYVVEINFNEEYKVDIDSRSSSSVEQDVSIEEIIENHSISGTRLEQRIDGTYVSDIAEHIIWDIVDDCIPKESESLAQESFNLRDIEHIISGTETPLLHALVGKSVTIAEGITNNLMNELLNESYEQAEILMHEKVGESSVTDEVQTAVNEGSLSHLQQQGEKGQTKKEEEVEIFNVTSEGTFSGTEQVIELVRDKYMEAEQLRKQQIQIEQEIEEIQSQHQIPPYVYFREIPNKPPPPYTPPDSVVLKIPDTQEEILDYVTSFVKSISKSLERGKKFSSIRPARIRVLNADVSAYRRFLFDLSKEVMENIFEERDKRMQLLPWQVVHKKPAVMESQVMDQVKSEVLILLGYKPRINRESQIIRWSKKKKTDYVDELLIRELQEEEPEWTCFEEDELAIKNQITDDLFNDILTETASIVDSAFKVKFGQ